MELSHEQLNAVQQVELKLFREFLQVCQTLKLRYYVVGGTLLGAVRHKGFIPWDDDIDVGMPREDYEVLLKKGQALLPAWCFLQTFETDPQFPANFAKLRDSRTTFVETALRNRAINHGIYIDIFPLDHYPEEAKAARRLKRKNFFLEGRVADACYCENKLPLKTRVRRAVCRLLHPCLTAALQSREQLFREVPPTGTLANHCGAWGDKEIMPAHWFGDGCQLPFEGLSVCAPKDYDRYLSQLYGDYMVPPPPEKRVAHHYVDVIDLQTSYQNYLGNKT